MALKLGKCRLCLKLGDFYSIFTVDNAVQLADMVMECSRVKVYEGDGLPDKVCSECIQKLSSAYIFKQQCERADQELRRNYIPPPGFSISPPPPNRQSSDSAFSNHTDSSNLTKPPSTEGKVTPIRSTRKRSIESDNASVSSRNNYTPSTSKRIEELKRSSKRPRFQSGNKSQQDSDYDDIGSVYLPESTGTDSDEPLLKNTFKCKECPREFQSVKSLSAHCKVHKRTSLGHNAVVNIPTRSKEDSAESSELNCEKCDKTFKLKIMLKRHQETCGKTPQISPKKELLVSLEPIDAGSAAVKIECEICSTKFKEVEYLRKHMRLIHGAVPKRISDGVTENVPCLYCPEKFIDYYTHNNHFSTCLKKDKNIPLKCPVCDKVATKRSAYILHVKCHFMARAKEETEVEENLHECRICGKKLVSQEKLIKHLAAHVSNIDDSLDDDESRVSPVDEMVATKSSGQSTPGSLNCDICDKQFTYKKALLTHRQKHTDDAVKMEPPDKDTSLPNETFREYDSESSVDGEDNTCDICEKEFSYKRLLVQHKRTKHNMCSGTKRSKITLKECPVRCLICDLEMKVSNINEHNQKHIAMNMKPRNIYTCKECGNNFKSCSALANHIKFIHRLKQQIPNEVKTRDVVSTPDLADFCEVVVTKAEPLDWIQSHNDFGEVPIDAESGVGGGDDPVVNMAGFTCPICGKQMPTLISLKRHVNWHTYVGNNVQKVYECFVCKEKFRFQCHYKIHMREHYHDKNLDPKFLTCAICNRRSKHLRAAVAHMNYHKQTRFQNKDYQCSICKRVFQFRKVYLSHMAIHYKRGDSIQNTVVGCVGTNVENNVNDGTHTCNICGKVCDSENSLKHHTIWHKSKTSLYGARHECDLCNLQFTGKKWLEMHRRTHYEDDNGPFKCNICGKGYTSEEYHRRHMKSHNFDHVSHKKRIEKLRKDKVKCPICNRYYPDLVKLIRHLRRTHPESKMIKEDPDAPPQKYYACKLCAKVFLDERRLQHHEEAHLRKPEFFKCKFCGKKTISLKNHRVHIKAHLTMKHVENPLKCPHCEELFVRGYDLHHHLRDVHDINETWIAERTEQVLNGPLQDLQCSVCFKVLASQGNFQRHIDYHNSLRCNYCFDYFSGLRFLEGHLAFACEKKQLIGDTEIYPKKVKCHICYKAFHLQVKLDCHLRTQHDISVHREASSGKKESTCDYCFKVFENEYALTNHKIYHRTVGYYGCTYCKKKFNTLTLYRKHKNAHLAQLNVDNPTKCEHCDETFVAFREFIYHMRDVHGDNKEWVVMPKDAIEETCPICNKVFLNLHKHLGYHEENKCKKCGEYFYSTVDCDNHLCAIESDDEATTNSVETKEQKYEECRFCFKPITKKNSKKLHDQIHKGSGSISCRFCSLKFKTMDAFNIHAFSHRSRKYNKRPIKCRKCGEKFVQYGPFMRHMKQVHKITKKVHYRRTVKPEKCRVCGDAFPNLHNHYRAHLLNQCQLCQKYFTSCKLYSKHECDKEDADPTKVFMCDESLTHLINTYIPKDEKDDEKFYGYSDEEDEETAPKPPPLKQEVDPEEKVLHEMVQSPIISDVLSLFHKEETKSQDGDCISQDGECISQNSDVDVVNLTEDDSVDINDEIPIVVIDDD